MRSVLQLRRGNRDNFGIIFIFFHKNIFCDLSFEPSWWDGSNEGSQHMFLLRNKKIIFELSSRPPLTGDLMRCCITQREAGIVEFWLMDRLAEVEFNWSHYIYSKNSKIWDTSNNCHNCPKNRKVWCNIALMHPKDADGMANSVDPDQTASSEAVWFWSALFAETYLSQYIEFVRYLIRKKIFFSKVIHWEITQTFQWCNILFYVVWGHS